MGQGRYGGTIPAKRTFANFVPSDTRPGREPFRIPAGFFCIFSARFQNFKKS